MSEPRMPVKSGVPHPGRARAFFSLSVEKEATRQQAGSLARTGQPSAPASRVLKTSAAPAAAKAEDGLIRASGESGGALAAQPAPGVRAGRALAMQAGEARLSLSLQRESPRRAFVRSAPARQADSLEHAPARWRPPCTKSRGGRLRQLAAEDEARAREGLSSGRRAWRCELGAASSALRARRCELGAARSALLARCCSLGASRSVLLARRCRSALRLGRCDLGAATWALRPRRCDLGAATSALRPRRCDLGAATSALRPRLRRSSATASSCSPAHRRLTVVPCVLELQVAAALAGSGGGSARLLAPPLGEGLARCGSSPLAARAAHDAPPPAAGWCCSRFLKKTRLCRLPRQRHVAPAAAGRGRTDGRTAAASTASSARCT